MGYKWKPSKAQKREFAERMATDTLCAIQERQYLGRNQNKNCNFVVKFIN